MADSKISALSAISALGSTDELVVATAGASKKITGANLGASIALTSADAVLGGDVTMVNANTFYDGPSASLAAGTWLLVWKVNIEVIVATAQSYWWTGKLWDGTTVYDESEITLGGQSISQNGWTFQVTGFSIAVLGSPATIKISVAPGRGSSSSKILRDVVDNPATSHKASRLSGIKIG